MLKKDNDLVFKIKKTTELSDQDIEQLLYLIRSTVNVEKTKKNYKDKYLHNFLGYSFHALMIKDNKIVGCNTVIPQEFNFFNKNIVFGQWCETLIDKNFRGGFSNFKKLGKILNENLLKNNIFFIYGLPNRALYIVSKRLLGMQDIGKLDYYVYPKKMNKFLTKFYPLNIILCFALKTFLKFKFRFNRNYNFKIYKINNENFHKSRYLNDNNYKTVVNDKLQFTFKLENSENHNNAKIIWIMDIYPLSRSNLEECVNQLINMDHGEDLIVYIGKLRPVPYNLIKIPDKFIKEHNIFSGKILDETKVDKSVFDYKLWNINSSNFDYR